MDRMNFFGAYTAPPSPFLVSLYMIYAGSMEYNVDGLIHYLLPSIEDRKRCFPSVHFGLFVIYAKKINIEGDVCIPYA